MQYGQLISESKLSTLSVDDLCEYAHYIYDKNGYLKDLMVESFDFIDEDSINEAIDMCREEVVESLQAYQKRMFLNEGKEPINEGDSPNPGRDPAYWIPNLGWLGGLVMAGLTAILGLIGKALAAGKQQLAILLLRRYMKKLVELTDDGIKKRRFLWTERNRTCFRTLQEGAELQCYMSALSSGKALGLVYGDGRSGDIGGLETFRDNIATNLTATAPSNNGEEAGSNENSNA